MCLNQPLIIGLFCRKWPIKIRHPMTLRHPVWDLRHTLYETLSMRHVCVILNTIYEIHTQHYLWDTYSTLSMRRVCVILNTIYEIHTQHYLWDTYSTLSMRVSSITRVCVTLDNMCLWNTSSVNPKSTSNQSSKPCTVLQYERWGAGVETQKNVQGDIGGWGRVPFNETYAPSLSTIYDGA